MPVSIPLRITSREDVTILCASGIVPAANHRSARIVVYRNPLKVSRPEYVVHTELLEVVKAGHFQHVAFSDGSYVANLSTALDRFNERCAAL